jgi:hypothetical protein
MSPPLPEFQRYQYAFTAHIRNPKVNCCPSGIEPKRMRIYRKLVYKNVESFLLACFPVLKTVLGSHRWSVLVRCFLAVHRSQSPFFYQVAGEFIKFLQTPGAIPGSYPKFLLELAHYEWVELALSVSTAEPDLDVIDQKGCLLEQRPVLNPVLANLRYSWPVHRIAPRVRAAPAETYLLLFRDVNEQVQFTEINAFTSRLLNLLATTERTGLAALEIIARESNHPSPEIVIRGGSQVMQDLQARGALLGVARE